MTQPNVAAALKAAVAAIYFDDSSDYGTALWQVVQHLGGDEAVALLESREPSAYERYRENVTDATGESEQ